MSETLPLVTIGVPIYNEDRFLRSALQALVAQDYPNIEIIICDNASTDNTEEICRSFLRSYSHIQYHRSDTNLGAYANGRAVIDKAKGKYLMFAAGHDLWHPTFISKAVAIMDDDPEIVLCYAKTTRIDTNNNPVGFAKNSWDLRGMPAANRVAYLVNNISGGEPCYGLIRFQHLKAFQFRSVWGLDQVMLAHYALQGTIAYIPEPLFCWRLTEDENVETRKKTVPMEVDPIHGKKMLNMSMTELWRQMGEATIQVINRSDLTMPEKLACKDEVRKCFVRRYNVQWNEVIPSELKSEGKNILLTTSAAPDQTPFSTTEKRPPIGVGFLISTLREAGHNVFFIDNYLSPSDFLETDYLKRHRIDYVGIYTNTICFRDSLRMFHRLQEHRQRGFWQGKIIAGGPHASVVPETIPPFVDHIVIGEGEYALRDIVTGTATERVIHYPPIQDLDKLPMPAWDYFAELPYNWGGNWLPEAPVFTMNTSRGCPFSCTFCSVCSIWGKRYTCFSAERVVADIEHVVEKFGAKGIYFREDNFTLNRERLVRFCQLMIERNIRIPWVCESRVSNLDRDLVALMARAGAVGFYFGVESGSQRLLDFMKKGISVEQIRNAFQWSHKFGIKTAASVIVGVPTETEEDLNLTMALLKDIKPTVTWFNIFVGIPNSELLDYARKNNYVEFTDDRGLAYLKGHNRRTELFYGSAWDAKIPITVVNEKIANPQISVVMSVYNGEKHLRSAVQSILAQGFMNYEFIIVDDASSDATPEILKAFSDPRITILRNKENLGLTASLNCGILAATGKYIARMDADDLSVPHRFAQQFDYLEKNPSLAVVGSSYYTINEEGAVASIINVLAKPADIKRELPRQNWFGHGSVMMRKSCLEEIGGYDEQFIYAQDYDLFLRLSERYDLTNITTPLYSWRESTRGISISKKEEQKYFADMARSAAVARRHRSFSSKVVTGSPTGNSTLVSVIVPTYNRPEMLATAIESILSQTMQSFEIVVVNDAGSDVLPVVNQYQGKGCIRHIVHETNRGLAAARNTGIRAARGKYIAYLDDDDTYYPNHLETLTEYLESHDCRVAYTDANRALQQKTGDRFITVKKEVIYSRNFNYDAILVDNFIPVLCVMHEKDCLSLSGMFDESLPRHEDWDLWIRMSRNEQFTHLPIVTCEFTYRPDGSGMTSSTLPMFLQTYKAVYRKHSELAAEKPLVQSMQLTSLFNVTFRIFQFIGERLEPYLANSCITDDILAKLTPSGAGFSQIKSSLLWRQAVSMDDTPSITHLEMALIADSENHPARIAICERYFRQGRHSDALEHIEFLAQANPNEQKFINTRDTLVKLIGTAIPQTGTQRQYSVSIRGRDNSLDGFQQLETCRTRYDQIKNQLESLHLDEAIRTIKDFLTVSPDCAEAHNDLGALYYRDGNKLQTLGHYEKAVRLCPLNSTFRKNLASFYFVEMGWTDDAIAIYTDMLNSDPEDIDALTALGIISNALDRKVEAGIFFSRVIKLEPWNDEVRKELATLNSPSEPCPEILLSEPNDRGVKPANNSEIDDIRASLHKQPLSPEDSLDELYRKTQKLADNGFIDQAITNLHRLLLLAPDNALFHNDLAVLYVRMGDAENALFHQEQAVGKEPLNRNFRMNLAGLYYRSENRIDDAIYLYTELLKEKPDDIDTLGALAIISSENERPEEARIFLKKIVELEPNNMDAHRLLERINNNDFIFDGRPDNATELHKTNKEFTACPTGTVTIIIPVYNRLEFTEKCLETLSRNTTAGSYELILVDNGSTDGTADFLQKHENISKVISNPVNLGFAKACNQGAEVASGNYLVFLNNDTEPQPGWLDALLKTIQANPEIGAVGSKLLYPDSTIQHAGVVIVDDRNIHDPLLGKHIYCGKPSNLPQANIPFCYQALTAASLMISRSAFIDAKGFDECFWNGYEDVDLCFKLKDLGYLIVYTPESVVIHHESKSGPERFAKAGQNIDLLHKKWLGKITPDFIITDKGTTIGTDKGTIFPYKSINAPRVSEDRQRIPLVSIVILTFNQLGNTKNCIDSIQKHTPELHEIIFIDNGSTDGTTAWLHELCINNNNYTLISNKENRGFAAGCNQGIEAAVGESVLLLNNDVIVTENWLDGLLECLLMTPDGGIAGPMTNNISGIQQVPGVQYESVEELDALALNLREKNRHRRIPYRRIVGFCMLFRRELVNAIGLLDESFGSGNFEDDDFCLRAELEGYRNVIAGDVFIHHVGSATFKGNNIDFTNAMMGNKKIFNDKWSHPVTDQNEALKILTLKTLEKAEIHYQRGEIDKAIDTILQEGISNASNENRFYFALAEYFIDQERFNDAMETLKELPESAEGLRKKILLGRALAGLGNLKEAEELTKSVLLIDPSSAPALTLSGRIAYDSGRQMEAISRFKAAITEDPGYGEPYTCLGLIALQENRVEESLNLFEKGFLHLPLSAEAANNYHSLITASGNFKRAEDLFREMHSFYPQHRTLHFLLIDILIQQDKYQQAIAEIEQACTTFGIEEGMLTAGLDLRQKIGPLSVDPKKKKAGKSVSLCMIIKNEEKNLPRCLKSLKPIVDEIIIVDTGSTDGSRKVAELFGAKVFDHPWTGDFSEARNKSLEQAQGNWILVMDADEVISSFDYADFLKSTSVPARSGKAYIIETRNYSTKVYMENWRPNDGSYSSEERGAGWIPSSKIRLFPNLPGIRFEGAIHELVHRAVKAAGITVCQSKIPVHHYGYLDPERQKRKEDEYYLLGKKKLAEVGSHDLAALCELAIQAGNTGRHAEAVELWNRVLELDPSSHVAHFNLGFVLMQMGRFQDSRTASSRAIELQPAHIDSVINYVICDFCIDGPERAQELLERNLEKNPGHFYTRLMLAISRVCLERTDEGLEIFAALRSEGITFTDFINDFAGKLIRMKHYVYARCILEAAVSSDNVNEETIRFLQNLPASRA